MKTAFGLFLLQEHLVNLRKMQGPQFKLSGHVYRSERSNALLCKSTLYNLRKSRKSNFKMFLVYLNKCIFMDSLSYSKITCIHGS